MRREQPSMNARRCSASDRLLPESSRASPAGGCSSTASAFLASFASPPHASGSIVTTTSSRDGLIGMTPRPRAARARRRVARRVRDPGTSSGSGLALAARALVRAAGLVRETGSTLLQALAAGRAALERAALEVDRARLAGHAAAPVVLADAAAARL